MKHPFDYKIVYCQFRQIHAEFMAHLQMKPSATLASSRVREICLNLFDVGDICLTTGTTTARFHRGGTMFVRQDEN